MGHTPGPWELVSLSGFGSPFSIRMAYHSDNPNASKTHYGVQSVRTREDARLIAAAPDLLAVAKECLELAKLAGDLTGGRGDDDYVFGIEDRLNAAIAKAEGR